MKKVVVITGTSSGVGLELATLLAKDGFTVYATMRNLDRQTALQQRILDEKLSVNITELDVTNDLSIEKCFAQILAKEGRIDILVNNAGAGFIKSTEQATLSEINSVIETNFLSVVKCTKAVIGQMRIQKSGHIINIGSVGGLVGQPFNELYCAAKFAVEGYTESLASYLTSAFNIDFTVVEPGGIKSEFAQKVFNNMSQTSVSHDDEYQIIMSQYLGTMNKRRSTINEVYQSSAEVAQFILDNVINKINPPIRIRTSAWAEKLCLLKTASDPDGIKLRDQVKQQFLGL